MKLLTLLFALLIISCNNTSDYADTIIVSAKLYTASTQADATALAIKDDLIIAIGNNEEIKSKASSNTNIIDAAGQFIMPGFIEGHGHFSGMGETLQNLNFLADTSWQTVVKKVKEKVKTAKPGEWIYGRGWHQEKWNVAPEKHVGSYPTHHTLSEISPDNPVLLVHASGHSLFANELAMKQAGITKETAELKGGKIVRDGANNAIGVFEENAMIPIKEVFNDYKKSLDEAAQEALWYEAIALAQKECLENGVTSFQDAGSKFYELKRYEQMALDGKFDMRLWAMIRHKIDELKDANITDYKRVRLGQAHYTCAALKTEVDGALGAHGAWLLEPYEDKPDFYGQNTTEISEVKDIALIADQNDMQLCVHAIGDRANKEVLDIIQAYSKDADKRWRIEHAQHLSPTDIMRFKETGAIAAMQAVHCTSDAPFVEKRLGAIRAKVGAYAWKALLNSGVTIVNGTDVPVEDIDPIKNFYAAVTRTRIDNGMQFYVANKMSREEALRSYTIDAAYGAFEDDIKGSLEVGKLADLIMLSNDLRNCSDLDILNTEVLMTMVGGKIKYQK